MRSFRSPAPLVRRQHRRYRVAPRARKRHDRALLRRGAARGRQHTLDELRLLIHGQLKTHVLAVQQCVLQLHTLPWSEAAAPWLAQASTQIDQLLAIVIGLHQTYRESLLPDDLEQALVDIARSLVIAYPGCTCRVEVSGVRLAAADEGARRALLLVLYNALSNALTHAKSTVIIIQLQHRPTSLLLRIIDNGSGEVDPQQQVRGRGLRDMAHMIRSVGGSLTIQGVAGAGTTVTAVVPRQHALHESTKGASDAA